MFIHLNDQSSDRVIAPVGRSRFAAAARVAAGVLVFGAAAPTFAADLWTVVPEAPAALKQLPPGPQPDRGAIARVNPADLEAVLDAAPDEIVGRRLAEYGSVIELPLPDGTVARFAIADAPVMAPELQERYPWMRSYIVQGIDEPTAQGRLDYTQRGFRAFIRTQKGGMFIEPVAHQDLTHVVSFYLSDLPNANDWTCHTVEGEVKAGKHGRAMPPDFASFKPVSGDIEPQGTTTLRTYRTAIACTGEWGVHHSMLQGRPPNLADPLAAIVTVLNRTNVVYEADLGVRFNLVANNDLVVYFDPTTDPYPDTCDGTGGANCSGPYITPNVSTLGARIGDPNFDIGHLLTRVFGGVAALSSACTSSKAVGISGIPRGGDADPLSALVVVHEFGHQLGALHTFNGTRGRCAGNATLAAAWEPGGGSTPMAYPGACPVGGAAPSDNLVTFADPWFHHGSYREMVSFITGTTGDSCVARVPLDNAPPVVTWPFEVTFAIPPRTPFQLSAIATDPDGDALTYSWEQFDTGVQQPLTGPGSEDDGRSPIFRVFPPTTSPTRVFPRMSDILSGVPTPGEQLPSVQPSTRRFRVYVRDNRAGGGAQTVAPQAAAPAGNAFVTLAVPAGPTPFVVTAPAANARVKQLDAVNVAWDVGGTNVAPINVANVALALSADGGRTFPFSLEASTSNDGSQVVQIPAGVSGLGVLDGRIRVDAIDNVFFNVSPRFQIVAPCGVADFNWNGQVDFFDYLDFVAALADPTQVNPAADINKDGLVDFFDYLDFVAAFDAGCV
jgi:hypothetical protein